MKTKLLAAAALAGAVAAAGAAHASITIKSTENAIENVANGAALSSTPAGIGPQIMIDNFGDNLGSQTPILGITFTPNVFDQDGGSAGYIRNGFGPPQLLTNESAPPPVAGVYETGNYYTVTSDGGPHEAVLQTKAGEYLRSFSFYLGSPDTYNSLTFYDENGNKVGDTLTGHAIWACPSCADHGDQTFGARAYYNFNGVKVTKIVFGSSGNSFEFDNLAANVGGVPEPASWALMIAGFGLAGATLRARRRVAAAA